MDMVIALKEPLFSQTESQVFGRSVWLGPVVDCINGSHLPTVSMLIAMHLCNAFLLWLYAQFCDLFWPKHSVLVPRLKSLCMFRLSSGTLPSLWGHAWASPPIPEEDERLMKQSWVTQRSALIHQTLTKLRFQLRASKLSCQAQFGSALDPADVWEINVCCFSFWGFVFFCCCCYTTIVTWYLISCVKSLGIIMGLRTHRLVGAWVVLMK